MKKILGIIGIIIATFVIQNNNVLAQEGFGITDEYVSGIHVPRTDDPEINDEALHIVTKVADRILSLVSLIAIIIFMIGGYKVITAGGDDSKAKSGYKFIKNAIIGIIIIGLTRAIVRLIFWFVGGLDGDHTFDENSGG